MYVNPTKFFKLCDELSTKIINTNKNYEFVYGVPRGGTLVALYISQKLGITLIDNLDNITQSIKKIVVVDDLIDSGVTKSKYKNYDFFVLINKQKQQHKEWIEFFYEKTNTDMKNTVIRQLEYVGENANREGLIKTPERVVRMWKELYRGYDIKQKPQLTVFNNGHDGVVYDEMIIDKGIFYSNCEHHMIPFFGKYYFAYIPNKKIIGLSKVAKIVDFYCAKLQIQERLVKEILDELETALQPKGIALIMKARHLCKEMRGCKKIGEMVTNDMRGVFRTNHEARNEFLSLVNNNI